MMATLEKKRLRLSPLDIRFHLRDLIGSGHLRTVEAPSGLIVKVAKDWDSGKRFFLHVCFLQVEKIILVESSQLFVVSRIVTLLSWF